MGSVILRYCYFNALSAPEDSFSEICLFHFFSVPITKHKKHMYFS